MSWQIGYDETWKRDIGYGVPAICDHPDCNKKIDRGLSYVCGGDPYGGGEGCGLYFCAEHLNGYPQLCERCMDDMEPFNPKPDVVEWLKWKLSHKSWANWRIENSELVKNMKEILSSLI